MPDRCGVSQSWIVVLRAASLMSGQPASGSIPHQGHPSLELACGVGPGQRAEVLGGDGVGEGLGDQRRIAGFGAVGQDQRAQAAAAARQDGAG